MCGCLVTNSCLLPHYRLSLNRLLRPWDFLGKKTGVGCHFLFQCMKMKSESEVAQTCLTLSDPMDCSPPGSSVHGILQTAHSNLTSLLTAFILGIFHFLFVSCHSFHYNLQTNAYVIVILKQNVKESKI